jgi:hypothetical protein
MTGALAFSPCNNIVRDGDFHLRGMRRNPAGAMEYQLYLNSPGSPLLNAWPSSPRQRRVPQAREFALHPQEDALRGRQPGRSVRRP